MGAVRSRQRSFRVHNLYGGPGQEQVTAALKAELLRLKQEVRDDDQFAKEQLPNGVDGPVAKLRGKMTAFLVLRSCCSTASLAAQEQRAGRKKRHRSAPTTGPSVCAANTAATAQQRPAVLPPRRPRRSRAKVPCRPSTASGSGCSKDDDRIQLALRDLSVDRILLGTTVLKYRASSIRHVIFPAQLKAGASTHRFPLFRRAGRAGQIRRHRFRKDPQGEPWINTACEGEGAAIWWPNKDQWRDEVEEMELRVAVPNGLVDVSNGKFAGKFTSATATPAGRNSSTRFQQHNGR